MKTSWVVHALMLALNILAKATSAQERCAFDSDCGAGQYCPFDPAAPTYCVDRGTVEDGWPCTYDEECSSRSSCSLASTCGYECQGFHCIPPAECEDPNSRFLLENCTAPLPPAVACTFENEAEVCPAGYFCDINVCGERASLELDASCTSSESCISGCCNNPCSDLFVPGLTNPCGGDPSTCAAANICDPGISPDGDTSPVPTPAPSEEPSTPLPSPAATPEPTLEPTLEPTPAATDQPSTAATPAPTADTPPPIAEATPVPTPAAAEDLPTAAPAETPVPTATIVPAATPSETTGSVAAPDASSRTTPSNSSPATPHALLMTLGVAALSWVAVPVLL